MTEADKEVDTEEKSRFEPYCQIQIDVDPKSLCDRYYVALRYVGAEDSIFGVPSISDVSSGIDNDMRRHDRAVRLEREMTEKTKKTVTVRYVVEIQVRDLAEGQVIRETHNGNALKVEGFKECPGSDYFHLWLSKVSSQGEHQQVWYSAEHGGASWVFLVCTKPEQAESHES